MTDPIRIETEDHHIHLIPKVQDEPPKQGNPYLLLFVGFLVLAIALHLWHPQSRSTAHQPTQQEQAQ